MVRPKKENSTFFEAFQGSSRGGDDPILAIVSHMMHAISEMEFGVPVNKEMV